MLASRLHWRLLIGTILVLMAAAWLAPFVVKPPAIQENRILAAKPAWPQHLQDFAAYRKAADAYVADHFPARPHLIGVLNRLRMLGGASGSERVIIGRDGWLFFDDGTHLGASRGAPPMSGPELRQWLTMLAGRTEALRARHIPYLVVAAPVKETIYPQLGPPWYPGPSQTRPTVLLPKLATAAGAGDVLYLYPDVAEATRRGLKTYSRHDTHWTGYGAYAGYVGLMRRLQAMGLTDGPRPMSDFVLEPPTANRPRDLALMLGVASFVPIDFPHIDNPQGEARTTRSYLTPKTDWTAPQVVDTGEVGKPVLLMTRDSFSNELLPFLYPHFSRIVLAHNQDGAWRPDLIDRFKPDLVILEVIEHGLRVSMGEGPPASKAAAARIDRVLENAAPAIHIAAPPVLGPPTPQLAALMAGAKVTGACNLEIAKLTPGEGGEASFSGSGWISGVTDWRPSPEGLLGLKGPGGMIVGTLTIDKVRPDVGTFFKDSRAAKSGFVADFRIHKLAAGRYDAMLYRRVTHGWIACVGKQTFTVP